jgi:hypothetical protein
MLKRIFLVSLAVLVTCLIILTTMYLVIDDATLVSWARERLADATGIEISSQEPIHLSRTLSPTLSARDLLIRDPANGSRIETSELTLQISLPALVLGRLEILQLRIGETRVETVTTETDQTDLITLLREIDALPLRPVLRNLEVEQITLVREDQEKQLPELQVGQLEFRHAADKDVIMVLRGLELDGHALDIQVEFPPLHRIVQDGKAPFTATVRYQVIELKSQGLVDLDAEPNTLSATLDVNVENLDRLSTGTENLVIPGSLTATARLSGTTGQLSMQDLKASWKGPKQSTITLEGSLGKLLQLEQAALQLEANLVKPDWLLLLFPDDMKSTQNIELSTHISGSAETLLLEDFRLRMLSAEGLAQLLTGKLEVDQAITQPELANLNLEYGFSAPTTIAARALLFPGVPEFGKIKGRVKVHSTRGNPSLEDVEVTTRDEKGIRVRLTGNIASFPLESDISNDGYDLAVHIAADNTQIIAERMGIEVPLGDPLSADFRIEGSTNSLRLEKIAVTAGTKKKVQLQANGHLHFGSWDKVDPVTDMNLDLRLSSRDTPLLAKLLRQQSLPELGSLLAKAQVRSQSGKHRINNIRINTTSDAPLYVELKGVAGKLVILPEISIDGIRLEANAKAQDVSVLQSVLKTDYRIPAIGPVQSSAAVTGSSEALSIDKFSIDAGESPVLRVHAQGPLGRVAATDGWRLKGTDILLNASAPGSQAFAEKLGYLIPELGPISARATINDKDKTLGIETANLTVGESDKPVIRVTGLIDSFLDPGTGHWSVVLDISGRELAAMITDETLPDLADLSGKAIISDADGSLGIDSLEIRSNKPDLLTIDIHGNFRDFHNPETLSLDGKVTARDMKLLGSLIGVEMLPLGPVQWDTRISQREKNLVLTSSLVAEKTRIDADILGVLSATPPLFKGTIKADSMFISDHVEDLTKSAKQRRKEKKKKTRKDKKAAEDSGETPIFSRTPLNIDWMRKVDLDIDIDVASFDRKYALADSGKVRVVLKSGKLSTDPFHFNYGKQSLDLSLQLDVNNTPSLAFRASAEDLNLWEHLDLEAGKHGLYPYMHVDIDLNASGNSEHELASSANGKLFVSMEHGMIQRDMMNFLFVDIIGWATTRVSKDKYEKINCGLADLSLDDGVVSTRAFLIDTDDVTITGEGTIDLGKETIDYVMLPKKKSRIIAKAEPVKITGELDDPSITALPLKSAAATYGSLIFGPIVFAGVFASQEILGKLNQKRTKGKESACDRYKEAYEARLGSRRDTGPETSSGKGQATKQ